MSEARNLIDEQFAAVAQKFTGLKLQRQDNGSSLAIGKLNFSASYNGESIEDQYLIEMEIPAEYPRILPKVKETGERIPPSFHRYEDATLCLGAPLQVKMKFQENPTLIGFIEDQVIPYLYSYSYFEKYGEMPFGELSHGGKGITEYYKRLLQLDTEIAVLGFLRILADDGYRGHHNCPCSSGKKLRACHGHQLREIMAHQSSVEFALEYLHVAKYLEESGTCIPKLYFSKSLMKKYKKSRSISKGVE